MTTISAFSAVFYVSCNKNSPASDKCMAISCNNGASCTDGVCNCPAGYEGTTCQTLSSTRYTGTWKVSETGTVTGYRSYTISIGNDPANIAGVIINNYYNFFTTGIKATIKGDTITIPNQQYQGKVVFGKGYIYADSLATANSKISMQYEVVDSASGNKIVDDFGYYSNLDNSKPSSWAKDE